MPTNTPWERVIWHSKFDIDWYGWSVTWHEYTFKIACPSDLVWPSYMHPKLGLCCFVPMCKPAINRVLCAHKFWLFISRVFWESSRGDKWVDTYFTLVASRLCLAIAWKISRIKNARSIFVVISLFLFFYFLAPLGTNRPTLRTHQECVPDP